MVVAYIYTNTNDAGHARYALPHINVEDVRRLCSRSYASRRLCRTISEERQLPFTHPRSHFPPAMEWVPLRLLRIGSRVRAMRRAAGSCVRAGSRLLTCTRVRAVSARGYRSTVQYRFFRNAGHTQGEPAEKRLTVNRDALPSDNIIQFREPAADRFRGNCVPTDRYVLRVRRSSQS